MDTVSQSTVPVTVVEPFVGSTPYAVALDLLASTVRTNRRKAWQQVQPLVPSLSRDIAGLVRVLKTLNRKASRYQTSKNKPRPGVCSFCKGSLPHNTPRLHSRHGHYMLLARARKNRWSKYPGTEDRRAQTALARSTVLAARHDRWVAALRARDPLRTEHLLRSQGSSGVIAFWRSLPRSQQKRLLKAVPPPPKRLFKGEILVRKGLRPYRPAKGKDYSS